MQSIPSTYQEVVRSNRVLVVPRYQRHYRWGNSQYAALGEDILRQYRSIRQYANLSEEEQARLVGSHYMGAVVLRQSEESSDQWDVIDGQQRLTTVTLLLAALRDHQLAIAGPGRKLGSQVDPELVDLRKNYNSMYFVTPPTKQGAKPVPRFRPQPRDQVAFNAILNWSDPTLKLDKESLGLAEPSNTLPAYHYFRRWLRMTKMRAENSTDWAAYSDLFPLDADLVRSIAASRLLFIEVRTTSVDDANAIFESLNFKVVPLNAVDLLKNYLFMLLRNDDEKLLDEWWNPTIARLGGEVALGNYILSDLVSRGQATSRNALYEAKQSELRAIRGLTGSDGLWTELIRLRVGVATYLEVTDPTQHCNSPQRRLALAAIQEAQGLTAVPLLMYILRFAMSHDEDEKNVLSALRLVESYLVRRYLCGEDGHNLNSYFSSMLAKAHGRDADLYEGKTLVERIALMLDSSGKDWPDDDRLEPSISSQAFYGRGEPSQRMLVLRRIDRALGQGLDISFKDSEIELEHVFPRGAASEKSGSWLAVAASAGMSIEEYQRKYLNSLVNIVPLLKSENLAVSNHSFEEKLPVYAASSLKITSALSDAYAGGKAWTPVEMAARAASLAALVSTIWPKPDSTLLPPPETEAEDANTSDDVDEVVVEGEDFVTDTMIDTPLT